MPATLSILGLMADDPELLAGIAVPNGMNRDALIDYICMECAELEVLFPRPALMKRLVTSWASTRLHSWERLYQSTIQEYNMIHNYDRYELWTDSGGGTVSNHGERTETPGATITKKTAAYNENTLKDVEQSTEAGTRTSESAETGTSTNNSTHNGHLYGNIGVTTAAQMLEGERELNTYNVYMAITNEFKRQFCIIVY